MGYNFQLIVNSENYKEIDMLWYENYGFKEDPYAIVDPMAIPSDVFIKWNRDDLAGKQEMEDFITRVVDKQRIGMKLFGTPGSGKTWLLRYITKQLKEKLGDEALIIYISIPRIDPTFAAFYERFIERIKPHLDPILGSINEKAGDTMENWSEYLKNRDLSNAIWNLHHSKKVTNLCDAWLLGRKLPTSELRNIDVLNPLEKDYQKHEVFKILIQNSLLAYSTCTLMVDEIGYLPPKVAQALGDSFRETLDSFYEKFSLICTYTAEIADEMLDYGYNQFLFTRLERQVKMETIKEEYVPEFLKIYQATYRKEGFKVDNQLFPFEHNGLKKLTELMNPKNHYPRFILTNCGILAKKAAEKNQKINANFVNNHKNDLKDLMPIF